MDRSRVGSPFLVEKVLLSRYSSTTRPAPMLLAEEPYPVAKSYMHERSVKRFYKTKESPSDCYE